MQDNKTIGYYNQNAEEFIRGTYHQWVNNIYSEYSLGKFPKDGGNDPDWAAITSQLSKIGKKYAHVIIDETQDFPIELLKILKKLSDYMTCFIEPNQAIEVGKTDIYKAIKALWVESPYKLTKNFRSTKLIRDLSALYCKDGELAPSDAPGKKTVITKYA